MVPNIDKRRLSIQACCSKEEKENVTGWVIPILNRIDQCHKIRILDVISCIHCPVCSEKNHICDVINKLQCNLNLEWETFLYKLWWYLALYGFKFHTQFSIFVKDSKVIYNIWVRREIHSSCRSYNFEELKIKQQACQLHSHPQIMGRLPPWGRLEMTEP